MKTFALLLLLSLFSCNERYDLVISNVQVVDMETGAVSQQHVCIKDSIIAAILPTSRGYSTVAEIDGTHQYLIPGLWDMHAHIQDTSYLTMFLDYGITGVRDMGGCADRPTDGCESVCSELLNQWKQDIKIGVLKGPELHIAGPTLSGTGWPNSLSVLTKEEVAKAFQINLENKVDFIKVYEEIPRESYFEIARLAKMHGLDFAGHVSESMLLTEVSDLGQKSVEHLREAILFCFTEDPEELEVFMQTDGYTDEDRVFVKPWLDDAPGIITAFKRNNTWFTPTMAVQYARQRYNDTLWIEHSLRNRMPESVNEGFLQHLDRMRSNSDKKGDSLWWMAHKKLVKRFQDEGVKMLAGSDAACEGGLPGFSLHEELFLMVESGLTPLQTLQTATTHPAAYFGFENQGVIRSGYAADLVLLEGNPVENIRNSLKIRAVVKDGTVVR